MVLYGQGWILVALADASLAGGLGDSFLSLQVIGPLPMIFWLVMEPLAYIDAVILAPSILFIVVDILSHAPFWIFHNPGWEIPAVGWFSLCWFLLETRLH